VKQAWNQTDREAAYIGLCEALTAVGSEHQVHFLARLSLLLAEELSDPSAFARALDAARCEKDEQATLTP
jgi:hypothetical protein